MTPRPRLSRLVARLRNPMRSKTLSRRPWPLIRSPGLTSTKGSDLRSDDCSAAPWVELKHVLSLGPWGHLESHKDATSVDAHTSHLHLSLFRKILVKHLTKNNRSLLHYYYCLLFCIMYVCLGWNMIYLSKMKSEFCIPFQLLETFATICLPIRQLRGRGAIRIIGQAQIWKSKYESANMKEHDYLQSKARANQPLDQLK